MLMCSILLFSSSIFLSYIYQTVAIHITHIANNVSVTKNSDFCLCEGINDTNQISHTADFKRNIKRGNTVTAALQKRCTYIII